MPMTMARTQTIAWAKALDELMRNRSDKTKRRDVKRMKKAGYKMGFVVLVETDVHPGASMVMPEGELMERLVEA